VGRVSPFLTLRCLFPLPKTAGYVSPYLASLSLGKLSVRRTDIRQTDTIGEPTLGKTTLLYYNSSKGIIFHVSDSKINDHLEVKRFEGLI